ncbi:hypothetical protein RM61_24930 [Xanthomonas phaseoli pv. phaseoli]|uniref:hypothetical protein n=1 Tax=Xanthomonas phaseoli TaxID=1985254 RepID=UPI00062B6D2C|nr:hypothetical protein [Xanthomonas phaseoli]KKY05236.1 hypothetical protein RM61_24930 [Xanthomonas phaseoli pv. phaseoli]
MDRQTETDDVQSNRSDAREDVFFRRLAEARGAEGSSGIHWSDLPMSFGLALHCAHLDHCVLGLHGLLEVLHASEGAHQGGQPGLDGDLTDQLLYASRALAASAKDTIYSMRDRIASAKK